MKTSTRPVALAVFVLALLCGLLASGLWRRLLPTGPSSSHRAAMEAHGMAGDPGMIEEHHAALELLPEPELATHVAKTSGAWFDATIWEPAEIPGPGAIVLVPAGIEVTYDGASEDPLFLVRVDGKLDVHAGADREVRLVVDTLFSTPDSRLTFDAQEPGSKLDLEIRPFDLRAHKSNGAEGWSAAAKERYVDGARVVDTGAGTRAPADFETLDDGPGVLGRHPWDPKQLSLGLIAHGEVRITGRPKLAKATLAEAARPGTDVIRLSSTPNGWLVGDRIVVTSTHYVARDLVTGASRGSQDEVRTIRSIEGKRVRFHPPLEFDHTTPRADLDVYAANLTRSVHIHSTDALPLETTDADRIGALASRLGHVMFMHNEKVDVSHATFDGLGRSNKNDTLDDFYRNGFDGLDAGRQSSTVEGQVRYHPTPPPQVTNPRGRYSVHVHRAGALASDGIASIRGCVVTGGPGWGFVSHDSRVDFIENVTFGVLGAGFVAETGNETGLWKDNIAIHTYGAAFNSPLLDPRGLYRFENDDFHLTLLLEKRGSWKNHDFGHLGDGFWFQGKLIDVESNVSVSSGLAGYFYMFRAPDQINVDPAVLDEPLSVHSPAGIHPFASGLTVFEGNVSVADRCGLAMIGQGGGRTNDERSVIQDFTAWEVGQMGTHSQYYPAYTLRDSTFLASASPAANPTHGVNFLKVMVDVVLANLTIEGFAQAYDLRKSWSPGVLNLQGFDDPYLVRWSALESGGDDPLPLGYAHVLIDAGFDASEASLPHNMGSTYRAEDLILTSADLVPGRFEVEFEDDSLRIDLDNQKIKYGWLPDDPIRPTLQEGHVLLLRGTKTDSIGSIPIDYLNNVLVWHADAVQHRLETEGFFTTAGGHRAVLLEEVFADRYTAEKHVVRFLAELDPRWNLDGAIDRGVFRPSEHPDAHVPAFLSE